MARPKPRHVIWITTDHMRFDNIRANGNALMHTPHLDSLVEHGVNFTNCFVQNPVCMPSRTSFMTGLYPQQVGVTMNGYVLPPDFQPVPAGCFKAGGYHAVHVGKLHFQPHEDHDLRAAPRYPYGFDAMSASEEAGPYEDAYMTWLRTTHPELVEVFRVPRPTSPVVRFARERAGTVLDAPWQASQSGWVADITSRALSQNERPLFIHMGFFAPHPPLNPTGEMFAPYADADIPAPWGEADESADKPEPIREQIQRFADWSDDAFIEYRRHFCALVTGVDLAVGQVMALLREQGLLEETLIVFQSDHGDTCGDHRTVLKHPTFYDSIMRVPWVLHWPAGLGTERRDVTGLVEAVDILPTLLELTGSHVPEVMVGRSYADALLAGAPCATRQDVIAFYEPDMGMIRTDRYKFLRYPTGGGDVLYDLAESPAEVTNRANDPACASVASELKDRMLTRFLQAGRSRWPRRFRY